ncbi:MAG: hypothetical protein AB1666_03325 [Pseudomonadota bacterium]|uniref:Uncharacterized protein n=1 Tax=Caldimonas aquatica TaxID=376175 RepID=A0ABY6MU11_9BURK|nr:hypothetical protein [Schlegelella aquatica]UZD55469.1 hypothetical protein OMP39_02435 [Schlegelella aquatica]
MGPLDAFWHLANFFAPAVFVGTVSSLAVKLLWRRSLAGVPWARLAAWSSAAAALALLAGLWWLGRDGKMATYAAMLAAVALAQWGAGWGLRRGR